MIHSLSLRAGKGGPPSKRLVVLSETSFYGVPELPGTIPGGRGFTPAHSARAVGMEPRPPWRGTGPLRKLSGLVARFLAEERPQRKERDYLMGRVSIGRLAGVLLLMMAGQQSESDAADGAGNKQASTRRYPMGPGPIPSTTTTAPGSPTRTGRSKTRLAGDPRLDRGREPGHVRLPRSDPGQRGDQEAADRALGLREVRRAVPGGWALLLHAQRGLQNQSVLYTAALDAAPKVLLDPNTLSADGTVALAGRRSATTATLLAYGLAAAGLRLAGVEGPRRRHRHGPRRRAPLDQVLGGLLDARRPGFYYSRFPEPRPGEDLKGANYYQKLYLPQARHAPAGRHPRLRAARPEGVAVPRQRHRRRRVPDRHRLQGDRRQVPHPLQGPGPTPDAAVRRADRQLRPRIHVHRQRRARSSGSRPTTTPRAAG